MQSKIGRFAEQETLRLKEDPANLRNFEMKRFSQNGEDGIIEEIFNRIGTQSKYFVEFGVEDGTECNTRYLLQEKGWSGLWIDGSESNVQKAKSQFASLPLEVTQRFVTAENIASIFAGQKVPAEFDLLSVDIDGNDYWVLKSLSDYKPRVLILEYNASYTPDQKWVMPYNPQHQFDGSRHYGASLASMTDLAESLGYRLVGCDSQGINAFFVRADLLQEKFTHVDDPISYHYCAPKYRGMFFGHPPKI